MDKSLGTLLCFWGVFQFTQVQPLPSPHKQCWTRVCRIFFRVSTLYRVGRREKCKKISKMMHYFKRERRNDREICILLWSILKVILSLFRVCVDVSLVTRVLLWSVYRSRLMRMCVNRFLSVIIFLLVFRPKCHQAWCLIKFDCQFLSGYVLGTLLTLIVTHVRVPVLV